MKAKATLATPPESFSKLVLHFPKDKENSYDGLKLGYSNFHKIGPLLVTKDTEANELRFTHNKNHRQIFSSEILKEK